jgi:transposase
MSALLAEFPWTPLGRRQQPALGTPKQVALRGRIVLAAGDGKSEAAIAAEMKVDRKTVRLWRERFAHRVCCPFGRSHQGRGRKATYTVTVQS